MASPLIVTGSAPMLSRSVPAPDVGVCSFTSRSANWLASVTAGTSSPRKIAGAREALHQLCGQALVPGRDEDGVPLWPAGTVGSITHGAGRAAAMVALARDWRGLGIDLEKHLSAERAARLAGEILTPAELQRAEGLDPEAFAQRVTLTFSLKESLFKALYPLVLTRFYFHDAELLAVDGATARLRLLLDLHADWPRGSELDGHFVEFDGYLLSVVAV